jgi:arsenate reductase (thioredoxin)
MGRKRVLFVCTHNSARSQMAEGMLRAWGGDRFEVASAGTEQTQVRPEAIRVMAELGIDISSQRSKTVAALAGQPFDSLVTVCDSARQNCPHVPGIAARSHWSIEDPSAVAGSEEERLAAFRRARDEIRGRIQELLLAAEASGRSAARPGSTDG